MENLRCLTLRQPWAYAITQLGKDVENRSWRTPYRGLLAIHAGSRIDRHGLAQLRERAYHVPDGVPTGVVVAVARLVDIVRDHGSPWARAGCWHWLLADVRVLSEPVTCPGRQSLWSPSPELRERISSSNQTV